MNTRIVPVPSWMLFWCVAFTLGHYVFIRRSYKDDPVVLAHEAIHVLQYQREGLLKFLFLYLLAFPILHNPWRARWEAEAFAVNIRRGASREFCAKQISGFPYLWACRYPRAVALLKDYAP